MKGQTITIVVLCVLLIVAVGYIGVQYYLSSKAEQQTVLLQQGYQIAVGQLVQQASTCQAVPVTFLNQTLNLVAVECLQAEQEQVQQTNPVGG